MKIYIVSHYYDNGESYEGYREYEDHLYYSSIKEATSAFWGFVARDKDYEGKYTLSSVVLDTQETELLEESVYLKCHSCYEDYFEPDDDYDDWEPPTPEEDVYAAWCCVEEEKERLQRSEEESIDEETEEWLNTPREQYELLEAIKKDEEEDKINELNNLLDNCLTL